MIYGEFIGLPGSGKTTVRNVLKRRFLKNDHRIVFCEEAYYLALREMADDPITKGLLAVLPQAVAAKYLPSLLIKSNGLITSQSRFLADKAELLTLLTQNASFRNLPMENRTEVIEFFLRTVIQFQTIETSRRGDRLVLFDDEAFVQRSASIFVLGPEADFNAERGNIERYFEIAPLPDILFHVKCDTATCLQRMKRRRRGLSKRLRGMEDERIERFLNRFNDYYRFLIDILKNRNVKIVGVDGNHSPIINARHIAAALLTAKRT
jgi:thymidylate kinase